MNISAFVDAGSPRCPVAVYEEYKKKRPPGSNAPEVEFFLRPKLNWTSRTRVWFTQVPVGIRKLKKFASIVATKGQLQGWFNRREGTLWK